MSVPAEPLILSLDTTSAHGSLALLRGADVLEEFAMYSPEGHSHALFEHIRALLQRHEIPVEQIDAFASASGPGAFTGVRVGLAAVKGLAEALQRPAYGISNLLALAACGSAALRAAVVDARRGDVFSALFTAGLVPLTSESVRPFRQWMEALPDDTGEVITPDSSQFRAQFVLEVPVVEQRVLAAAVGRVALERWHSGDIPDAALLDANYVRRSDAELFWRE